LEFLAEEMGMLLDGALDTINEASYELLGEPFWEGEDSIELNPVLLEEVA
jgi:hypothetical protein